MSKTSSFQLWRVARTAARVRVLEPGGQLVSVPSGPVSVSAVTAPRSGGTLELAEPAGGWSATLNGSALQSVPSPAGSWAQAFRLPAGGGTLDISHSQLGRTLILVLEALALLVVIALGLPGARVPGESAAGAATERPAGGRRERGREKPEEPAEPGLEPGSVPGEAEEPSRGSRLSRRAAAGSRAGTGRSGARRAAASGPGASRPGTPRPGAAGLGAGPGAPLSGPGTGRRGTLGPSRSQRHENEDLDAFPGADLAMDAGAGAATGFGTAAGVGSDAAGPPGDLPPALTGPQALTAPPASEDFWDQDDGPTLLRDRGSAPWEQVGAAPAAAALAGAESGGGQDDDPAADRGGRKRWLRGRKAKERGAPEPETVASPASGMSADGRAAPGGMTAGEELPGLITCPASTPRPGTVVGPAPARLAAGPGTPAVRIPAPHMALVNIPAARTAAQVTPGPSTRAPATARRATARQATARPGRLTPGLAVLATAVVATALVATALGATALVATAAAGTAALATVTAARPTGVASIRRPARTAGGG